MEYVPYMAMFCHSENMEYIIEDHLIPWVMNCLLDKAYVVSVFLDILFFYLAY